MMMECKTQFARPRPKSSCAARPCMASPRRNFHEWTSVDGANGYFCWIFQRFTDISGRRWKCLEVE
jgi:hypothetical protein